MTDTLDQAQTAPPIPDPSDTPEAPVYGENNKDLPKELVDALKTLVTDCQKQDTYQRRQEVMKHRRNVFYERGIQHIYENQSTGCFVQGQKGAIVGVNSGESFQSPSYIDNYNIFLPYERTVLAVGTQQPPGINFKPKNPKKAEDTEAARTAEGYRHIMDDEQDPKLFQEDVWRNFLLSGRTVAWTRTEANATKFGLNEDGSPKQREVRTVYGTINSKVPIIAETLDQCDFCILSKDKPATRLKKDNPDFADKIKPGQSGLGEQEFERLARLGVLQGGRQAYQSGEAFNYLTTEVQAWMRPEKFWSDKIEKDIREQLEQIFPSGARVTFAGDVYVGSVDETMDDHIAIEGPYPGDGMTKIAMMDPLVVVQDRFNDDMNAYAEVKDFGWPNTCMDGDDGDIDAVTSQKSQPYGWFARKARQGLAMEASFFREPDPSIPESFESSTTELQGNLAQFMLAAPPALFGGAESPDVKTAAGQAQAKASAMGQLGLPWIAFQRLAAKTYYQAALCAAKNPDYDDELVVPGGANSTIRLERLTKGKFGAYPDEDSGFPESTQAKRAQLTQIITIATQSPQIGAQVFGNPRNFETFAEISGFPEIEIQEADSYQKQVFEIEQLLDAQPVPDVAAMEQAMIQHAGATLVSGVQGVPPPPMPPPVYKSSVPVGPMDFDEYELKECQRWLSSGECRAEQAKGNMQGVQNVLLHAQAHQAALLAKNPPPPMPMPVAPHHNPMPKPGGGAPVQGPLPPGTAAGPSL